MVIDDLKERLYGIEDDTDDEEYNDETEKTEGIAQQLQAENNVCFCCKE